MFNSKIPGGCWVCFNKPTPCSHRSNVMDTPSPVRPLWVAEATYPTCAICFSITKALVPTSNIYPGMTAFLLTKPPLPAMSVSACIPPLGPTPRLPMDGVLGGPKNVGTSAVRPIYDLGIAFAWGFTGFLFGCCWLGLQWPYTFPGFIPCRSLFIF